jgi:tRNA dimethylallyltransferase
MKKIIVILGPTASGKSDLAVKIALWLSSKKIKKKFDIEGAEIISADSRQVYRGMDIGTGKITKEEMKGIPHYLLDVASPKRNFTVAQFVDLAKKAISKIFKKKKIPIICGGTWFYIYALVDGYTFPRVKPDWKLRRKLEKKSEKELFEELKKLDPERAKTIDPHNKRRLIRAIEIAKKIGKVPPLKKQPLPYPILFLGIEKNFPELKKLIEKRLKKRLKQGMIEEVKKLRESGVSWKKLESFGLEYEWIAKYLQGKIEKEEMIKKLQRDIEKFARRQIKVFKKDKRVVWIKNEREAKKAIKKFLEN